MSLLTVVAIVGTPAAAEAQADPAAVGRALFDAENRHDVEGAVGLFATDAVVADPSGRFTTTNEIRDWQTRLANVHFSANVAAPVVAGDRVTFTGDVANDTLRGLGLDKLQGSWELTVAQGRIKTFTFTFTPDSAARLQQALAAPTLPRTGVDPTALLQLGALAVALGGLLAAVASRRRRP